jgi:hypothetical protein
MSSSFGVAKIKAYLIKSRKETKNTMLKWSWKILIWELIKGFVLSI